VNEKQYAALDAYFAWASSLPILHRAGLQHDPNVSVFSWPDADRLADSDEYINAAVAASNDMVSRIRAVHNDHFQKRWNVQGQAMQPHKASFLQHVIQPRVPANCTLKHLPGCIASQVAMGAMEVLYSDIIEVLATGHVVCGYEGEYPTGKPIIF
jgi:hypothetical protein